MLDAIKEPGFYKQWFEAIRSIAAFIRDAAIRRIFLLLLLLLVAAAIKLYKSEDVVSKKIIWTISADPASTDKSHSLQELEAWATQLDIYFNGRKEAILGNIQDAKESKSTSIELQHKGPFLEAIVSSNNLQSLDTITQKTICELSNRSAEILPIGFQMKLLANDAHPNAKLMPWAQYLGVTILVFIFIASIAELRDRNLVTYPAAVTGRTGLPIMGMIPSTSAQLRGKPKTASSNKSPATSSTFVPLENETKSELNVFSNIAEQYRFVRASLQASLKNRWANTRSISVMITSATHGEGRTATAFNIALSLCNAGMKVVIIDAELRKPRIHLLLQMPLEPGLSSYLSGESVVVEELVVKTIIPNLYLMAAGPTLYNTSELLGSQRMDSLLSSLRENYDIIILDSSPLLPFVDAQELARKVDASIIIAQHGRLSLDKLTESVDTLRNTGVMLLGIVMTNVPIRDYKRLRIWYEDGALARASIELKQVDRNG